MLDHNSLPFYPLTAASQIVKEDGSRLEVNGTISVNHASTADSATKATSATSATNATTAANASKLGNQNPSYYYSGAPNYTYDGRDLSTIFDSVTALHTAVAAGDFTNIRNGDYWPITLNGSYYDYSSYTCPSGTTYYSDTGLATSVSTTSSALEALYVNDTYCSVTISSTTYYVPTSACIAYYVRTMSNAIVKLEANINVYWKYGDSGSIANGTNHIVFCSRDLLPHLLKMRKTGTSWEDTSATNPWLGSALYKTLNDPDHGVLPLLLATDIGNYIFSGPNGNGMRFLGETKAANATSATGWAWMDRGKLFLPTEREVWGQDVWSEHSYGGGAGIQWPVFAGSLRHVVKGLGNGGSRYSWWVQSSRTGSASYFCIVGHCGYPYDYSASTTWRGVPLCFLFV